MREYAMNLEKFGLEGKETGLEREGIPWHIQVCYSHTEQFIHCGGDFYVSTWLGYGTQIFGQTLFWMFL